MTTSTASSGAKHCRVTEADKLLKLPDDVLDQILACLPIKDAVRTSTLSSAWRKRWTSIPQLAFEGNFFKTKLGSRIRAMEWKEHLSSALLQHNAPLEKFIIDCDWSYGLDSWMIALSKKNIKHLTLKLYCPGWLQTSKGMWVPRFFTCQTLVHLELRYCEIVVPDNFGGLVKLTTLDLCEVEIKSSHLNCLISECPCMNKVSLIQIGDIWERAYCVKLNTPNLETLCIRGTFADLYLENAPSLKNYTLSLRLVGRIPGVTILGAIAHVEGNMHRTFWGAPSIEKLELCGRTFEYFADHTVPKRLSTPLNCLKILSVKSIKRSFAHLLALQCIIRSSPVLKELTLETNYDRFELELDDVRIKELWQRDGEEKLLSNLQKLRMIGRLYIELIEFVFQNAPDLEEYMLIPDSRFWGCKEQESWQRLKGLTRASPVLESPRCLSK